MNEKQAIQELKKVREYYCMKRKEYDDVITWLEGRMKRSKNKRKKRRIEPKSLTDVDK